MYEKYSLLFVLFFQAFLQVYLVCLNTYCIAKGNLFGLVICSFLISYIWTKNVKRISAGTELERIIYSSGAACGGVLGFLTGKFLLK